MIVIQCVDNVLSLVLWCHPLPMMQVFLEFDVNDNVQLPYMENSHRCAARSAPYS